MPDGSQNLQMAGIVPPGTWFGLNTARLYERDSFPEAALVLVFLSCRA